MKRQMIGLGRDALIYGLGSMILRFMSLLLTPLYTARLLPQDYGVLAMLGLLSMVVQPVFGLGLSASMGPIYYDGNDETTKASAVWTVFALHAVSAAVMIFAAGMMPAQIGDVVRLSVKDVPLVQMTLISCALSIMATAWMQRVQFEKQVKLYVWVTTATALISIVVSMITVIVLEWGVTGIVISQLVGNAVSLIAFLFVGVRSTHVHLMQLRSVQMMVRTKMIGELLRMGLPMMPSFAFLFILMQSNKYILEWWAGLSAVGVYSVGFNFGSVMNIITGAIAVAWYPFLMSYMERPAEARVIFGRVFTYYVFGIGFLSLLFFLAAKPVMILFTRDVYYDGASVVGFVALSYMFQVAFSFFMPGLYFKKEIAYASVVQAVAAVVALLSNYVLIRMFGVLGAGIGVALGAFALAAFMFVWNQLNAARYPPIDYEWRRIGLFAAGTLIIAVVNANIPASDLRLEIVKAAVAGIIGLGLVFVCMNEQEKLMILPARARRIR